MTSQPTDADSADAADLGLLSPVRAGSAAEAATGDVAFLQAVLDAEAALTRAQAALGHAPKEAARAVTAAADAAHYDVRDLALRARAGGNPVIPLVADLTARVRATAPESAAWVHRGATSQDIVDTAFMLMAKRALVPMLADLAATADSLAALARAHRSTPMPGRTLTQQAVPTTFGLKAAGWRGLVLDAHDRVAAVAATLPAELGGAAGTLAAFHTWLDAPANGGDLGIALQQAYASELGLRAPELPWHTLRTPIADLGGALAFTAAALGKFAEDVLVLSRTEIAEVAEGSGGGSSAMPHKSNPVRSTLIAAAARQLPALASVLVQSLAAADERPPGAWHAEWQPLREALRQAGGAARDAAELAAGLRVEPEAMARNLRSTRGAIVSERLSAVLGDRLGRPEAKDLLTRAGRKAAEEDTDLRTALVTLADPAALGDLDELLDPAGYLGSASALVDRALQRAPRRHPDNRTEEAPR